jgi:hypothetical protein
MRMIVNSIIDGQALIKQGFVFIEKYEVRAFGKRCTQCDTCHSCRSPGEQNALGGARTADTIQEICDVSLLAHQVNVLYKRPQPF